MEPVLLGVLRGAAGGESEVPGTSQCTRTRDLEGLAPLASDVTAYGERKKSGEEQNSHLP